MGRAQKEELASMVAALTTQQQTLHTQVQTVETRLTQLNDETAAQLQKSEELKEQIKQLEDGKANREQADKAAQEQQQKQAAEMEELKAKVEKDKLDLQNEMDANQAAHQSKAQMDMERLE